MPLQEALDWLIAGIAVGVTLGLIARLTRVRG